MTWVRLDDGFCDHPKIALLPVKSRWVHLHGLCYCNRYLTDGLVPIQIANRWEGTQATSLLVERGLWDLAPSDFKIVGYLDWNDSRAQVEERRQADAERKRFERASGRTPNGLRSESRSGGASESRSGEERSRKEQEELFVRFYETFPRHEGRGAAEKAFVRALKRSEPETIIAAATAYRDSVKRSVDFTALPATWLNQDRWLDEPEVAAPGKRQVDRAFLVGTAEWNERVQREEDEAIRDMDRLEGDG